MRHPNMSYCMFQNTLLAMRQLLNAMEEGGSELFADMSSEERRAFDELFNACEAYQSTAEQMVAEEQETS